MLALGILIQKGWCVMSEKIVCTCMSITEEEIKEAYENGAHTLAEIQEATGAGTVCGACVEEIEQILEKLSQEK